MTEPFLTFLAISLVVIVTPGQDTALTIRNTMLGGRRGGVMTAFGVAGGQAAWALATAFGVVALLLSSEPVFAAVKLAGACYIVFLGAQSLWAALRPRAPAAEGIAATAAAPLGLTSLAALRQGVVSNLGNPKMAVFFASLLPQFVPQGGAQVTGLILLGLVFCLMTLAWLTLYALAIASAGRVLQRPAVRRGIEGLTSLALVALGLRIATAQQ